MVLALVLLTGCTKNRLTGQWDIVLWEVEAGEAGDIVDDAGWLHFDNDVGRDLRCLLRYEWDGEALVPVAHPEVVSSGFTEVPRKVGEELSIRLDGIGDTWVITERGVDSFVMETDDLPEGGHSTWWLER